VDVTVAGFDAAQTCELIAPGGDRITAAPSISAAVERIHALDRDLSATGRCAVAIAVVAREEIGRWPIGVDAAGRLTIAFLGMTGKDAYLTAAGLPRTELGGLAELLTTARRGTPAAPNGDERTDQADGWPRVPPAPEPERWARDTDAGALLDATSGERHDASGDVRSEPGHSDGEAPAEPVESAAPPPADDAPAPLSPPVLRFWQRHQSFC
jgi:hypothetical protein